MPLRRRKYGLSGTKWNLLFDNFHSHFRSLNIIDRVIGLTDHAHVTKKGYPIDWRVCVKTDKLHCINPLKDLEFIQFFYNNIGFGNDDEI